MKTASLIQSKVLQAFFLIVLVFGTWSCMSNGKTEDTKEVAEEKNDEKFDNSNKEEDAQFLVNAAEINLEEIKLGQLAQQKSSIAHVKKLGKMMEDGHTKALADLTALAKTKMITIPTAATEKARDANEKLNGKSGKDFDESYSDMMVSGHKDAISIFEKAAAESSDADIKAWATATLPTLRTHLDHSIMCQKECEKK